ncbi:MAG: MFS transporter [Chloroflexi bacterium]|nr:MFS transporter [Chloroflexota bacterium]
MPEAPPSTEPQDEDGAALVARQGAPGWRRTLWASALSQLVTVLGFSLAVPFMPLYIQQMGVTDPTAVALWSGVVFAAPFFPLAIVSPIWGELSDRYGRKRMLIRAMAGGALVLGAMSFASNVWHLLALRLLQGGVGGTIQAAMALVATTAPKRSLGVSLGVMQTAINVGNSIGPLVGGAVAASVGLRTSFLVGGGLVFAAMLTTLVLAVESPRTASLGPARWSLGQLLQPFRAPGLRVLLVTQALAAMATFAMFPLIPLYVQDLARPAWLPVELASGAALAATSIVGAVAAVGIGSVGDRIGHRRVVIASMAGGALCLLPQAFVHDVVLLILLRGLMGIPIGGLVPSLGVLLKDAAPAGREGSVYGAGAAVQAVGLAVGPLVASGLAAFLGVPAVFLALGALLGAHTAWMARGLPRPRRVSSAEV